MRNVYGDPQYADVVTTLKQQLLQLKYQTLDRDEAYPELMAVRARYWDD